MRVCDIRYVWCVVAGQPNNRKWTFGLSPLSLHWQQFQKEKECVSTFVIHLLFRFSDGVLLFHILMYICDMILCIYKYRTRCACGSLKGIRPITMSCLTDALTFSSGPAGAAIPAGSKLISIRHQPVKTLQDVHEARLTEKRSCRGSYLIKVQYFSWQ